MPSTLDFDLIIAGGAMTGASLALAVNQLAQGQLKIAIIESSSQSQSPAGFDARSIALNYQSCQLLTALGLRDKVLAQATPIKEIHVSERGHIGKTDFSAQTAGIDYLGQVLELASAGQIFYQAIAQAPAISVFRPARITRICRSIDNVRVDLDSGQRLCAALLVGADGSPSACASALNIITERHDFNQVGLIANIRTALPHNHQAFERFTAKGPLALLPMQDNISALVWCADKATIAQLMQLSNDDFLAKLQALFGWKLGRLEQVSTRHFYPLLLQQASQIITHRAALIGNAAQTLHPVAGQGFNLGLRDAITLAEEIAVAFNQQRDIGAQACLQAYLARRAPDREATIKLTSNLVTGFSNQAIALILGRNAGLSALAIFTELKTPLLKRTLGFVAR